MASGGKREGAGRKPATVRMQPVKYRFPPAIVAAIRARAAADGVAQTAVVLAALRAYLGEDVPSPEPKRRPKNRAE